jgi:outer membrane protein OmpA-like peptidoglycan-associated protein
MRHIMTLRMPLIVLAAGATVLTGCVDPYSDRNRTRDGAITGALLGGVIGLSNDDNRLRRTVTGVAIGALAGGAIGSSLDSQAAELRAQMGNDDVRIVNTGSELIVTMPQDILFQVDSTAVRPDLRRDLAAVAANIQRYPENRLEVVGHTDSSGAAFYNQELSERRASAVATILRDAGVPGGRIMAYGRGEEQPVASNLTTEGRAQNRRVELIIRPDKV